MSACKAEFDALHERLDRVEQLLVQLLDSLDDEDEASLTLDGDPAGAPRNTDQPL